MRFGLDEPQQQPQEDPAVAIRAAALRARGVRLCGPGMTHADLDMVEEALAELRTRHEEDSDR